MKEYKVGQVLYLMSESSTNIIPIQVIEEVVKTTISGQEKTYTNGASQSTSHFTPQTYTIQLPDKKKTTSDISVIKGKLFKDISTLEDYMIKSATEAVKKIVNNAITLSNTAFENIITNAIDLDQHVESIPLQVLQNDENVQHDNEDGIIKVDLGNGQYANMKSDDLKTLEGV